MDLLVAVHAASVDELLRLNPKPCNWILELVWIGRVPALDVALLTEAWGPQLEQSRVGGAVWLVAVRAALSYWCMLPEERPPLLGVALEAVIVDRVFAEHRRRDRAVRAVAIGARNLPLA